MESGMSAGGIKNALNEEEKLSAENLSANVPPLFSYSVEDFQLCLLPNETKESRFAKKFLESWQKAAEMGMLNYELGKARFRQLSGKYRISVQLNEERCHRRRKPHQFGSICEPFDPDRWNFIKLKPEECLFRMTRKECVEQEKEEATLLAINASPLSAGHSLLVPSMAKCLPQVLTAETVRMAMELLLLVADKRALIIYNSLLAHASVNHLHCQILFWPNPAGIMAFDFSVVQKTKVPELFLLQRPDWYLPAFVFQLDSLAQIDRLANIVEKCAHFLIACEMAHNLFMCRLPSFSREVEEATQKEEAEFVSILLFPRRALNEGLDANGPFACSFVPAALEVAGLVPVYDANFFETITEADVLDRFGEHNLIGDEQFHELAKALEEHLLQFSA